MSPISLHRRMNRRLVSGIAALLVIFGALLGWILVAELTQEFDRALSSKARGMAGVADDRPIRGAEFANVTLPDGRKGRQAVIEFAPDAAYDPGQDGAPEVTMVIATEPRSVLLWKIVRFSLTLGGFFGVLLLAEALLIRNAVRRGLEPVEGLRRQLQILDPTHRGQRVSLQAPPEELAPILQRINDLLEQAEVTLAARRTAAR